MWSEPSRTAWLQGMGFFLALCTAFGLGWLLHSCGSAAASTLDSVQVEWCTCGCYWCMCSCMSGANASRQLSETVCRIEGGSSGINDGSYAALRARWGTKENGFQGWEDPPKRPGQMYGSDGRKLPMTRYTNMRILDGVLYGFHAPYKGHLGRWQKAVSSEALARKAAKERTAWHALPKQTRRLLNQLNRFKYPQCKRGLHKDMKALIATPYVTALMAVPKEERPAAVIETVIPAGPPSLLKAPEWVLYHVVTIYRALRDGFRIGVYDVENRASGSGRIHDHGFCVSTEGGPCLEVFDDKVAPPMWLEEAKPAAFRAQLQIIARECSQPNTLCVHHGGQEGEIFFNLGVRSADLLPALRFVLGASSNGVFSPTKKCPDFSLSGDFLVPALGIAEKHAHLGLLDAQHEFEFLSLLRLTMRQHKDELAELEVELAGQCPPDPPPPRKSTANGKAKARGPAITKKLRQSAKKAAAVSDSEEESDFDGSDASDAGPGAPAASRAVPRRAAAAAVKNYAEGADGDSDGSEVV